MEHFSEFDDKTQKHIEKFLRSIEDTMELRTTQNLNIDILRAKHLVDMIRTAPTIDVTIEVGDISIQVPEGVYPEVIKVLKLIVAVSEARLEYIIKDSEK